MHATKSSLLHSTRMLMATAIATEMLRLNGLLQDSNPLQQSAVLTELSLALEN